MESKAYPATALSSVTCSPNSSRLVVIGAMFAACSVRGAERNAGRIHLPEPGAWLLALRKQGKTGDLHLQPEGSGRWVEEVREPLQRCDTLFLFWLFWKACLRDSRRGWNPNWRNPDAIGLKSAPALPLISPVAPPRPSLAASLSWVFTHTHQLF